MTFNQIIHFAAKNTFKRNCIYYFIFKMINIIFNSYDIIQRLRKNNIREGNILYNYSINYPIYDVKSKKFKCDEF